VARRNARGAVDRYLGRLQRQISCVTETVFQLSTEERAWGKVFIAFLRRGDPVALGGETRLMLSAREYFRLVEEPSARERWATRTTTYYYTLNDMAGREIISYHWHSEAPGNVLFPHLHIGAGAKLGWPKPGEAHIPTGKVALHDLLRLAIAELGVRPRRKDWNQILRLST
jgi:hypothetical protein